MNRTKRTFLTYTTYAVFASFVTMVAVSFYDVSWWPRDEGVFAHLAERVASGEVYGVEVQDFHGGYHTLLNAWLFDVFGYDLQTLRYPLVVLTILQAFLVVFLLRSSSLRLSVMGGLASLVFGFLMFPNPSPNWYALFFAVSTIALMVEMQPSPKRSFFIGVVLGVCALFRHPSAIFLTIGILLAHLYETRTNEKGSHPVLIKSGLMVTGLLIMLYSAVVFELFGFVMYALPLLAFIGVMTMRYHFNGRAFLQRVVWIIVGGVAGIMPMIIYQPRNGDIWTWFESSFLSGVTVTNRIPFGMTTYIDELIVYANDALSKGSLALAAVQISVWVILFSLPVVAGWFGVTQLYKRNTIVHPALFIALAFGLVSFYYQITFYFFVSLLLFIIAITVSLPATKTARDIWFSILTTVTVFSFFSLIHGYDALVRPAHYADSPFERVSLQLEIGDFKTHQLLVNEIHRYTKPDDSIFVVPFDPELYFLSERTNPFPTIGTLTVFESEEHVETFKNNFIEEKPKVVVHNTNNAFNSESEFDFVQWLERNGYSEVVAIDGYRLLLTDSSES